MKNPFTIERHGDSFFIIPADRPNDPLVLTDDQALALAWDLQSEVFDRDMMELENE